MKKQKKDPYLELLYAQHPDWVGKDPEMNSTLTVRTDELLNCYLYSFVFFSYSNNKTLS